MALRLTTAGESHGPTEVAIVDGMIAGLGLSAVDLDRALARRQVGQGRGARQRIEQDRATILSGVRNGFTTGAPIALVVENVDHASWTEAMSAAPVDPADAGRLEAIAGRAIRRLRPGHADYAGAVKYGHRDIRDVLERASARETVMRVAAGGVAMALLRRAGVDLTSHVVAIGGIAASARWESLDDLRSRAEASAVRCADPTAAAEMVARIDAAGKAGDSLGGVVEVIATGIPVGLGTYAQWDRRLDGRLAQAVMSIPAIKGVEFGLGFKQADLAGSEVHDVFLPGFQRPTNNAGGLEGGVTNGQVLVVRAAMKPISTLRRPLDSVTFPDGEPQPAHFERADVCAVPAAGVVAEAMVAWVLADALLEKIGGDSASEFDAHLAATRSLWPVALPGA